MNLNEVVKWGEGGRKRSRRVGGVEVINLVAPPPPWLRQRGQVNPPGGILVEELPPLVVVRLLDRDSHRGVPHTLTRR